jgi:acyl-coenzyme A synthetase/AMP-(fatty) acid ligase
MARAEAQTLREHVAHAPAALYFHDRDDAFCANSLSRGTSLGGRLSELSGRSVLLATKKQLTTALALIELDGQARRITILPPDIDVDHLGSSLLAAEIDAIIFDSELPHTLHEIPIRVPCASSLVPAEQIGAGRIDTEWVLLTSGTTGTPKMVLHNFQGLTGAIAESGPAAGARAWATFYDIRRYGGLQIFLRAVIGSTSLVLSNAEEAVADHLSRIGRNGATHISGTPSHWRRALMDPAVGEIAPSYVRLSGEIADQTILDALRARFPRANIGHAYASTEGGVAFDVNDGYGGFPASYVGRVWNGVEMRVTGGSLCIRSPRTALGYIGAQVKHHDAEGFVDTGDIVELRGDRYYFVGRKGGIINVGGLKIQPEEIEAVINRHPSVRMSVVQARPNPITGAIAIADVVLKQDAKAASARETEISLEILGLCRESLPRHKVPALINFVPNVPVAANGKLARRYG